MTSESTWVAQANFKVPTSNDSYRDTLINVRADTVEELVHHLDELATVVDRITKTGAALNAAAIVSYGLGGTTVTQDSGPTQGNSPAPSNNAGQASGAAAGSPGGTQMLTDKWGGTYTLGRDDAPIVPSGPSAGQKAVHKAWVAASGKAMARWLDPRAKAVPGNFQKGFKDDTGLWDGDWAK